MDLYQIMLMTCVHQIWWKYVKKAKRTKEYGKLFLSDTMLVTLVSR